MRVGWLLDAIVFDTYHDEIAAAITRNGDVWQSVRRPDPPYGWEDTGDAYRHAFPDNACVVTHADIDLVRRVQADGIWVPGAFAAVEHFHCSHYYAHFGKYLLNQDYTMLPLAELERQCNFLFDTFGRANAIFIRPDSPLKLFAGQLAHRDTFAKDLEFIAFYEPRPESLVVVSSPKEIKREWRFVIADQVIVAGSLYRDSGSLKAEPCDDQGAEHLAATILATGYAPERVWVMDICETADGHYHLLEIGAFSFANLYGCDKDAVVRAVSNVAADMHRFRFGGRAVNAP
jgi:hypothetical protein